ncbi:hypothetical protein E0Z10_g3345 [Xylaria hypoxylon]|uniref:2EXR domain-containing protein n=1 Tax=Xylaria hypoxylon TaxID=37992 RepID=A0A4Z0Z7P0_9PEZI|nr:hypothetical protein E0Z10_g3345 [Xylaria hypoxylon]
MPFPFDRLPPELRLEIWDFAVLANARRRRVVEQNFQVYPTLDLVASPFFSVNTESRETARSFYPVRLEVYRRIPRDRAQSEDVSRPSDYKGFVYLSPELDDIVSVYRRAALYHSELRLEPSERSKMTAWYHRTAPMSEETRQLFRRHPDRSCLVRYASGHFGVQDWMEVNEWMLTFGLAEYRNFLRLLRSMRINTGEFAQVFGWG